MIDFKNGAFFKLKENSEYASRVSELLVEGRGRLATVCPSCRACFRLFHHPNVILVNS